MYMRVESEGLYISHCTRYRDVPLCAYIEHVCMTHKHNHVLFSVAESLRF